MKKHCRYGVLLLAMICFLGAEDLWAQGTRQGGRNRNQGNQRGGGSRGEGRQPDRSGEQGRPAPGFYTEVPNHPFDIILGRPTQDSVTVSLLAYDNMQGYLEYSLATTDDRKKTVIQSLRKDDPIVLVIDSLKPDAGYTYWFCWRSDDSKPFQQSERYSFHTQRPPSESFVFTVQADSHLDTNVDVKRYERTLANARANGPDFHIDLGDTFMTDKYGRDYKNAHAQYLAQRYYFGLLCHSAPLFVVLGNHDGEKGTGRDGSMLMWSINNRKKYIPNPRPDGFYSGNSIELEGGPRENYYAWQWGDALFMVLDPFMGSQSRGAGDSWGFSLGKEQYQWLASTLKNSSAKYKFVFIHHLVGGLDRNGRGGSEAAGLYEWGGHNLNGDDQFKQQRPGWETPIHQLLIQNKVSVVFHGHDHFYAKQDVDGIVYQLVPQPGHSKLLEGAPRSAADYGYREGVLLSSSGHLRVSVTPTQATVDYIRSVLPGAKTSGPQNGEVVHSYTLSPGSTMTSAQDQPKGRSGGQRKGNGKGGGKGAAGDAEHPIPAGTPAPDGIGVVVAPARSAPTAAGTSGGRNNFMVDSSVIKPLPMGAKMPADSIVQTLEGKPFDLNAAVASKPTILIFYRGGWCPYCNAHLHELQTSVGSLQAIGYQLLAVTTDTPEALRKTMTGEKLDYQLLSDSQVEVAGKFGLRYKVTDSYLGHVKDKGVDLAAQNGGYLLTPAAYVLDTAGTVRFVYMNNNYSVRVSQDALLKAARDALKK